MSTRVTHSIKYSNCIRKVIRDLTACLDEHDEVVAKPKRKMRKLGPKRTKSMMNKLIMTENPSRPTTVRQRVKPEKLTPQQLAFRNSIWNATVNQPKRSVVVKPKVKKKTNKKNKRKRKVSTKKNKKIVYKTFLDLVKEADESGLPDVPIQKFIDQGTIGRVAGKRHIAIDKEGEIVDTIDGREVVRAPIKLNDAEQRLVDKKKKKRRRIVPTLIT